MIALLKSELRKLLTVRSTYGVLITSLLIVALFAGYGDGFRVSATTLHSSIYLATESANAILFVGIILAIAGLLLFGNEYRFNTILYTLTSSNSRTKSLFAKFLIVTLYAVVVTIIVSFFSPLCAIVGTHLAGKHMSHQTFQVWPVLWHCLFVGWGYAMYAFVLAATIRNQIGALVSFLLVPLVGENILAAIFKWIPKYLPFHSLQSMVDPLLPSGAMSSIGVSTAHNALVAGIYIALGLIVSLVLFKWRDAN